jgi:dihydropteroate synthase-like protein
MKILIITGKLAERDVRRYAKDANVYVVDVDVAAFITPTYLKRIDLSKYDLVLVPGLAKGDWRSLEKEKGVKIRLGPMHAYDLKAVLENIDKIELSHEIPACKLLDLTKAEENLELVDSIDSYAFKIGDVKIGGESRMKIVAEVVDATKLSKDELLTRIEYYVESGADIIDLGIPLEYDCDEVRRAVKIAVNACNVPISVDTFKQDAIVTAVEAGAEMVMSISSSNIEVLDVLKDVAVVVVERDVRRLLELVEKVKMKVERVIADPILDPPLNVVSSLERYIQFRRHDATPLLLGAGNVTELSDADSIGMNALLAFMAEEIGVNLLFTTEASTKTRGSIKELCIASYMAKAAKLRKTSPKDLGINLLVVKEKAKMSVESLSNTVRAVESKEFHRDPKGDFRIWVDGDRIICSHEKLNIVGKDAKSIIDTVLANNLVSRLDHAAYLGRELKKAEIAAMLGKNYMQDQELAFGILCKSKSLSR